jgi:hypothetical protein
MGGVRAQQFDAVIGVGGVGGLPRREGIDRLITWIGVGAHREPHVRPGYRGPWVSFDDFRLFDQEGPKLRTIAPMFADHFFKANRRYLYSDGVSKEMQKEIEDVLSLATAKSRRIALIKRVTRSNKQRSCLAPGGCGVRSRGHLTHPRRC